MMAISTMDNALWDLKGKREGVPVCRLLGTGSRTSVPAYCTVNEFGDTPEEAKDALRHEVAIYLEDCEQLGILDDVLIEAGFYDNDEVWMSSLVEPPHEPKITII